MGHTRLGMLPKTRKWEAVVALLATKESPVNITPSDIPDIASSTLTAAECSLKNAIGNNVVAEAFYLMTKLFLASRADEPKTEIKALGIVIDDNSTAFDVIAQFQDVLDNEGFEYRKGDTGEIAQQAAGETLSVLLQPEQMSLFNADHSAILHALRKASSKGGFAQAGRIFFASFMKRFLNFYLSRATASCISSERFGKLGAISSFESALQLHCDQSARIVENFAGDWYSKTKYQQGIDKQNITSFMAVALKKLSQELRLQQGQQ